MKKTLLYISILIFALSGVSSAKNLKAFFSYNTFINIGKGPYLESYLTVLGKSVNYRKIANGKFQGSIQVGLKIEKDSSVVYFDKYNLLSPEIEDTSKLDFNFVDQQRISLKNGIYTVHLSILDKSSSTKPIELSEKIEINFPDSLPFLSNIELLESFSKTDKENTFSKNGYNLVPYVGTFLPASVNNLKFYCELYNLSKKGKGESFLINYSIQNVRDRVIGNFMGYQKIKADEVNVVLAEMSISDLPSGNYNLVVELKDKENHSLLKRTQFFQRSNPKNVVLSDSLLASLSIESSFASLYKNKDTLADYINSLRPISFENEIEFGENQLKLQDITFMQRYFYTFWFKRNQLDPYQAWLDYNEKVQDVNKSYGTNINRGYDTDRGRVMLKYGRPDNVTINHADHSAYPYEVWQYYALSDGQNNKMFVFYNPDLVSNEFVLLHSDARGEVYDSQWQYKLHKRNTTNINWDQESVGDSKLDDLNIKKNNLNTATDREILSPK